MPTLQSSQMVGAGNLETLQDHDDHTSGPIDAQTPDNYDTEYRGPRLHFQIPSVTA